MPEALSNGTASATADDVFLTLFALPRPLQDLGAAACGEQPACFLKGATGYCQRNLTGVVSGRQATDPYPTACVAHVAGRLTKLLAAAP